MLAHHIDHGHKARQLGTRFTGRGADRIVQGATQALGSVLQLLHAAGANAARRKIHNSQETGVVVGIFQNTQVSQGVFDFGAFKEAQAAIHFVRHTRIEQGCFHDPTLRIAAIQHRHFFARKSIAFDQLANFIHQPLRFCKITGGLIHPHRFTNALVGAQIFAQAIFVVANERVGRIQNVAVTAVVLFQLNLVLHTKLPHKVGHVAYARTAKSVNTLVIIAHGQHRTAMFRWQACNHLDPGVLQLVGVLKLINEHMLEARSVVQANGVVVAQQFKRTQHQLAKVDHTFSLALVFVELVDLHFATRFIVAHIDVFGTQTVFFATRNEPLQLLGGKSLVIDLVLFAQALDGRQLVLRVQNLEGLRQVGHFVMGPQKSVAQAVKGANPHAPNIDRQHGLQAEHHFFGGFVGEGDCHHAARPHLGSLQ